MRDNLLGALQCVAGAGDRQAAQGLHQRLQQIGATESQLAQVRQALHSNGRAIPNGSPSASPAPNTTR